MYEGESLVARGQENCTVKDLWYTVALSRCDEGRSVR